MLGAIGNRGICRGPPKVDEWVWTSRPFEGNCASAAHQEQRKGKRKKRRRQTLASFPDERWRVRVGIAYFWRRLIVGRTSNISGGVLSRTAGAVFWRRLDTKKQKKRWGGTVPGAIWNRGRGIVITDVDERIRTSHTLEGVCFPAELLEPCQGGQTKHWAGPRPAPLGTAEAL